MLIEGLSVILTFLPLVSFEKRGAKSLREPKHPVIQILSVLLACLSRTDLELPQKNNMTCPHHKDLGLLA